MCKFSSERKRLNPPSKIKNFEKYFMIYVFWDVTPCLLLQDQGIRGNFHPKYPLGFF